MNATTLSDRFAALSLQHGALLDAAATLTVTSAAATFAASPAAFALILPLALLLLLGGAAAAYLDARAQLPLTADLRRDRDLLLLRRVEALKKNSFVLDRELDEALGVRAPLVGARAAGDAARAAAGLFGAVLLGTAPPGERALAAAAT